MGLAEFCYNVTMHSTTKQSPFKVANEVHPLQYPHMALKGAHLTLEFNQDGEELAKNMNKS